jgi:hypothetical protein
MKSPSPNMITRSASQKSVFSRPASTKTSSLEERNIRMLIEDVHRINKNRVIKRDALLEVQAHFFDHLEQLYTWPLDNFTFAQASKAQEYWDRHLREAERCAYRAETIDPDHYGHLRYDVMCEIVNLESKRIREFMTSFHHYREMIYADAVQMDNETYCDDIFLSYLDKIQSNVIQKVIPAWVTEARRPPLTWYGFLHKIDERLLAPEYYDYN